MKSVGCTATILAALSLATAHAQEQESDDRTVPESSSFDISRRGTATVEDAYRTILSLAKSQGRVQLDRKVDEMSFDELAAQLESLCLIDPEWGYSAETCLRRDVMAYMACSYLGCRPGVLTGLLGMTRRYAQREMLYQRIIGPGAPAAFVSGSELLSVVTRVSRRTKPNRDIKLNDNEIH